MPSVEITSKAPRRLSCDARVKQVSVPTLSPGHFGSLELHLALFVIPAENEQISLHAKNTHMGRFASKDREDILLFLTLM